MKNTFIKQLDLFDSTEFPLEINTQELSKFTQKAQRMSSNIGGAIGRLVRAKRYHEVANQLSKELMKSRIENEKLQEEIRMLKKAN